jgi:hypothetical protein
MKMRTIYLVLCLAGTALPYWQFIPWVAQNGLNMRLFFDQLFANAISAFFAMDVIVSAAVLVVFTLHEARDRSLVGRWLPLIALVTVGVSLALPLLLYLRQRKLDFAVSG